MVEHCASNPKALGSISCLFTDSEGWSRLLYTYTYIKVVDRSVVKRY